MKKIFEETQKEFISRETEVFAKIMQENCDESGKISLERMFHATYQLAFEQSVGFVWEVMKKMENMRK